MSSSAQPGFTAPLASSQPFTVVMKRAWFRRRSRLRSQRSPLMPLPLGRGGFTIIELLVYLSIVAVAMTIFSVFTVDVIKNASRSRTVIAVEQNAQFIMNRLATDIQNAQSINSVTSSSISLTNSLGVAVIYSWDSVNKKVTYQAADVSTIQVRVTSLSFQQVSTAPPTISIGLTVAQGNVLASAAGQYSTSLATTVVSRRGIY